MDRSGVEVLNVKGDPMHCFVWSGKRKVIYPTWEAAEAARHELEALDDHAPRHIYPCPLASHFHHTSG
jgi:hypothetical protein